jgi:hypothetical protein
MIHYYIILLILTALASSITTMYAPTIIARYRQYKTVKERKLTRMIRAEVERQLKDILND